MNAVLSSSLEEDGLSCPVTVLLFEDSVLAVAMGTIRTGKVGWHGEELLGSTPCIALEQDQ